MRPKRDPVPRAKEAWLWLGGMLLLGFLGAGVAVAATLLWENVDVRQLTPGLVTASGPLPEPEPARHRTVDGRGFSAVFFDSQRNRDYFPDPDYHVTELDRWRDVVTEIGGTVRNASSAAQLRTVRPDEVLFLVESPCIAPAELAAVRAHLSAGGSLVANWAVGVRDAECGWRGWQTLREITEAEDVRELPSRRGLYMTVPGGIALSAGLDPGTRIELRPDPSLALRLAGPRVYWSDWALNPEPDEGGFGADVAAAAGTTPEGGRTAWFGQRLGQAATPADSVHLRRLVQNGIVWAAGGTIASVAAWPGAFRAALVFALDVEDQPRNAMDVAALFEAEGIPGSFYAVSRLVEDDEELAAALTRAGEVGSHTTDHAPLGGLTAQDQSVRLRRSWTDIEGWTGIAPSGLRPPEDAFDSTTIRAWHQAGGAYIIARNESRSASPEIHLVDGDGAIVLLPRLLKDDYNVVVQDQAIMAERIGEAFLEGASKVYAIGGLAVVAGHTQIMQTRRRVEAFRTVADGARAQGGWWLARADEVARWWRARAGVALTFVAPEPSERPGAPVHSGFDDVLVESTSGARVTDLRVDLVVPGRPDSLVPLVDGEPVDFESTDWGIRVPVGTLEPDTPVRISLVLVDASAERPADAP